MSHMIPISNDLYTKIADYAQKRGQQIDTVVETILASGVQEVGSAEAVDGYDPSTDPLAEFIGAFDCGDEPGWLDQHDEIFGGMHANKP